jgi:type III pantothenate kinase
MELMIDIGNTNTVLGLYQDEVLTKIWRLSSKNARTEDECWMAIDSLFGLHKKDPLLITGVAISSVVPELTLIYQRMVKKYLTKDPLLINPDLDLGMNILYQDPYTVGADRICNAVAGKLKYGTPLIILDFGTATTFDCLDKNGDYLGGIICPGIESAAAVLHFKAAKLPKIDLVFPDKIIGRTTEESMQSGILYGSLRLIEGMIPAIRKELDSECKVIATGGLAGLIASHTGSIDKVDESLNIEGIYLIYCRNRS